MLAVVRLVRVALRSESEDPSDGTRSPKQGYQWPYKKTNVLRFVFYCEAELLVCLIQIFIFFLQIPKSAG